MVLEAKDFFVPGPDRRDLHLIILDQFATTSAATREWNYACSISGPVKALKEARILEATALDTRFPYFFRVREFVFVTPTTKQRTFGIVMSLLIRHEAVKGLRVAFERAPEAVAVSPKVCDFPLSEVQQDEIVSPHARRNVSCAVRFSEFPASKDAQRVLCAEVRDFRLIQMKACFLSGNYYTNPRAARRRMAQLFNAACSALAAVNCLNDDKRTHMLTATVPDLAAFPLRLNFTIPAMSSECGRVNQRPVYLWVVGARSLICATIQQSEHSYEDRSMSIRLFVPIFAHRFALRTIKQFATTQDGTSTLPVCVKLGPPPAGADPLYQLIAQRQLFGRFSEGFRASAVLDAVYGAKQPLVGPVGPQHEHIAAYVGGRSFELRPDQVAALQMADLRLPVLAIQAAFGTGKTVVSALIAARTYSSSKERVIATTTTNTAVAQFTETLLCLDDYKHLDILRYVSDAALVEGASQTPIDLHTILKRLLQNYKHLLSEDARDICLRYKRGRELLERCMFERDLAVELSDAERDEYRLVERDISDLTREAVAIIVSVRPPAVLCIKISALLNSISAGGIFCDFIDTFTTIIGDEASQIPEPALVALATHLPQARHVYIGDIHQLEPHARCPRTSNAARLGAQGVMVILLAKGAPTAPLTTTFRAHPLLNELPNLVFYNHTLVSGNSAEDRQLFLEAVRCTNPSLPFLFVDVPGCSIKSPSGSHSNETEAEVCRQIVLSLLGKGVQPSSIAIIVFYKDQARALKHFAKTYAIDLHTVDSVQGRKKDIVILITTRTGFDAERGEFLNEPHRFNVALSRCRHGQFVLGREQSLSSLSYWQQILQWASNLNAVTTATTLPDLLD